MIFPARLCKTRVKQGQTNALKGLRSFNHKAFSAEKNDADDWTLQSTEPDEEHFSHTGESYHKKVKRRVQILAREGLWTLGLGVQGQSYPKQASNSTSSI